jgi:hypothetical protein
MRIEDTHRATLVETLVDLLGDFRGAFSQDRVFQRSCSLVLGSSISFARKTMTQLLTSLGQVDEDWTAAYRLLSKKRFDPDRIADFTLNATLPHVPVDAPYQLVVDVTHVPRSSLKMPGTSWTRAPGTAAWARGFARAQRFENISWLTPIQEGYSRAIPLKWIHAPSEKAVPTGDVPCREWEAASAAVRWVRERLDAAGRQGQRLLIFADGAYDVNALWTSLPPQTTLVVRCSKNRKLFDLPKSKGNITRGARRKYGPRTLSPEEMRHEQTAWSTLDIPVRGKNVHLKCRVVGPHLVERAPDRPVFLLLVKGYHGTRLMKRKSRQSKSQTKSVTRKPKSRLRRRPPCQYLVNAVLEDGQWKLPLPLKDLIIGTWHRWEVEVCHREIKTSFGLGDMQCWSKLGSTNSVQFMAWAYAMLVLAGYKAHQGLIGQPCPRALWWPGAKRWSLSALLQGYRSELWGIGQFKPVYPRIPDKRQIIHRCRDSIGNSALGSVRG